MHLLPTCLARLADVADKRDSTRFALGNVSLQLHPDGSFTADATDSKCLIRVTGPSVAPAAEYPAFPALDSAPNGASRALVPAAAWRKAFSGAEKHTRKVARRTPVLGSVAVVAGDQVTTFGATDTDAHFCETVVNGEGRFPPIADILGQCRKGGEFLFAADPVQLANLLRTLADFTDECMLRVEFFAAGPDKPVMIRTTRPTGIQATGVIMPLAGEHVSCPAVTDDDSETVGVEGTDAAAELNRVRAELATVRGELNRVRGELVAERAAARERDRSVALASGGVVVAPAEVSVAPARDTHGCPRPLTRAERIALIRAAAAPATV